MKTKIKIGCHIFDFSDECELSEMSAPENLGNFIANETLMIKIRKNVAESLKKETTMHELLHAFCYNSGLGDKEESVVQSMGYNLMTFITDNKQFFREYFLNEKSI